MGMRVFPALLRDVLFHILSAGNEIVVAVLRPI